MKQCVTGKVCYPSKEKAEADSAIMAVRHDAQMRVYGCPKCGYYHLTTEVDNIDSYEPFDIHDVLLQAVHNGEARVIQRLSRGTVRYQHDGYVFRYAPSSRSEVVIERTPQPTDFLHAAILNGQAKMVRKLSNAMRVFEYESDNTVYTFVYRKTSKRIEIKHTRKAEEEVEHA